jgi:hypothetical protein
MAFIHSPKIVTDGLVLYLDAANRRSYGGSGATWSDLSGNNFNCTLVNTPSFSAANNGTIVFDGTNNYAEIADSATLRGSKTTVLLWFKRNGVGTNQGGSISSILFGKADVIGSFNGYVFGLTGGTTVFVTAKGSSNSASAVGNLVADNTWHHAVLTVDIGASSADVKIYQNGVFTASATVPSTITISSQPIRLIDSLDTFWGIIAASMANVSMYNRILSPNEILQNFNATRGRFGV